MSVSMHHLMYYHEMRKLFLLRIIAADEKLGNHFDPNKSLSMEWRHHSSPQPKKASSSTRAGRVILTCFFDVDGILLLEKLHTVILCHIS
ncbi:hypothetical protein NPIL_560561 [Nephila pilipes]|uniref:Uncharacterized protein n=1 Tax=Nephila pilipes TaxID=299642 RepID=A0A8X6U905_NEPPI|nr:hypothetical protein NPIL_560561 [Nephila pilipes]